MNELGIGPSGGAGLYLGLPEFVGRKKRVAFSRIKEKVHQRLTAWDRKFLTRAGKEVLIKSVALAMPNYAISTFLLPKSLIIMRGQTSNVAILLVE